VRVLDVRFPTSKYLDGSDAMNPDRDYSAAYVVLGTDQPGLEGHGLTLTIGCGSEICCAAIEAMRHIVVGLDLAWIAEDMGRFWRHITSDRQLRWIGPDKGAIHLATAAVVNAVWHLCAKSMDKPVWQLVADMSPAELVRRIDYRYVTDCITPDEALALLRARAPGNAERLTTLQREGYPRHTTSAGWQGYDDAKLRRLCQEAVDTGLNHVKMKVGRDLADDIRRLTIAREVLGPDPQLMIDANQVWDVGHAVDAVDAVEWVRALSFCKPWFVEEPTSSDDVEGHRVIREGVAPVQVAPGEMCHNRIGFKQFIVRDAIDVVQIEKLVCPHAGGAGLCDYVQHLSVIDYLCIGGTREGSVVEYVDHLHEHFIDPCVVERAAYMPPRAPGFSITMKAESLETNRHWAQI
jgi:L-fuconate dehydratase